MEERQAGRDASKLTVLPFPPSGSAVSPLQERSLTHCPFICEAPQLGTANHDQVPTEPISDREVRLTFEDYAEVLCNPKLGKMPLLPACMTPVQASAGPTVLGD